MAALMRWVQMWLPRLLVAYRGYCLKYVDDAGLAPKRTPNARAALNVELKAKRITTAPPPIGIWVVGYLDLRAGQWQNYDHVFLMKYKGNGKYEIRDSESESGFRSRYTSIGSILAWFNNYNPKYVGWSYMTDGRKWAKPVVVSTPKPKKVYYTVVKGDTLSGIAAKKKTTLAKLDKLNPQIKNLNQINIGQRIRIK